MLSFRDVKSAQEKWLSLLDLAKGNPTDEEEDAIFDALEHFQQLCNEYANQGEGRRSRPR